MHSLPSNLGKASDEAEKQDAIIIHLCLQIFYASCIYTSLCYFFSFTYLEIVNISTLENSQVGYLGGKFKYFPKAMASSVFFDLGISFSFL